MSESEKSGTPNSAPADLPAPKPNPGFGNDPQPIGSFGSTRGSGLARGKRASTTAASSTPAPTGYKPTALEVISPQSEYKNPFTGETSVRAPVVNEPAQQAAPAAPVPLAAPTPTPTAAPAAVSTPKPAAPAAPATPAASTAPTAASADLFPFNAPAAGNAPVARENTSTAPSSAEKSEIKILPPEGVKRPAQSWETPREGGSTARPDERTTFRTERNRREGGAGDPREGRPSREGGPGNQARGEQGGREGRQPRQHFDPREAREPRRENRGFERRPNQAYTPPAAPAVSPQKAGGFLGWLKGLLGLSNPPAAEAPSTSREPSESSYRGDGGQGQRGYRGGRGRGRGGFQGDNRGPRDPRDSGGPNQQSRPIGGASSQFGGGEYPQGEPRGEGDQGGRRRRRRGGRGRFRDGGEGGSGDRGPSPEGQQGGGAI